MKTVILLFITVTAMIGFSGVSSWGSDPEEKNSTQESANNIATEEIYIDVATMHRYIKNPDGNYSQYNRKGEFFQIVSPDLPLLTTRAHVIPVKKDCYLLYVNKQPSTRDNPMTLKPAEEPHPKGWFLEKALVDLK